MRGGASEQVVISDMRSWGGPLPLKTGVHHLPQDAHPLVELVDDGSVVLPGLVLKGP